MQELSLFDELIKKESLASLFSYMSRDKDEVLKAA